MSKTLYKVAFQSDSDSHFW